MMTKPRAKRPAPQPAEQTPLVPDHINIRMYRLAVGDCFLVSLPRGDGTFFHMLIDCGIHMAATGGKDLVRAAAADIADRVHKNLQVVVGTHEHWDHLSGFHHAKDIFESMTADKIWCAWTEDENDDFAKSLVDHRDQAVQALWGAVRRLRLADSEPDEATTNLWNGVFGFFGDSPGTGVLARSAAQSLRDLATSPSDIVYHKPGDPPFDSVSDLWRVFVLGPPRDKELLNRADPRPGTGEAYPFAAAELAAASLAAAVSDNDDPPFGPRYQIPLEESRIDPFFCEHYWNQSASPVGNSDEDTSQDWRMIGNAWLSGAATLALTLDRITNNTSLVLALEFGPKEAKDNPVILFAADAQVGNWLSWEGVHWDYAGRRVSGLDLLRRTVIYKVGHHASQNATLMRGGLEEMKQLRLALVSTSAEMAGKVGWGTLPWPKLLDRLTVLASNGVLRSDTGGPSDAPKLAPIKITAMEEAYFDVAVPLSMRVEP
jgi:hypothetical protein